jgi:hypothetical protein
MAPYLLTLLADFYLLPLLLMLDKSGGEMFLMLIAIPAICLVCSAVYGIKHSFHILYPAMAAVLFVPSVFIFYNWTAWSYAVVYGLIALIGNAIGKIFHKHEEETR